MSKCPVCDGAGGWSEYLGEGTSVHEPCGFCNETGQISLRRRIAYWLWNTELGDTILSWLYDRPSPLHDHEDTTS